MDDLCFRLLSLQSETQCELEVVKPVLEELEVLHLSCTMGMLTTVNKKDFQYELLSASDYDDDFARFLRCDLFAEESDASGQQQRMIKSGCLFGKQVEVKQRLSSMNLWSPGMGSFVDVDGIYAVLPDSKAVGGKNSILLFAWIQDHFFEPHRLRDTATYVLRFLTCLTSDIICCLSVNDVNAIEKEVQCADISDDDDDFSSYSVAFHVEKQEDQKDGVHCVNLVEIDTESSVNGERDVYLLKGSFCGLAIKKKTNEMTTEKVNYRKVFTPTSELSFGQWLLEMKNIYSVRFSPATRNHSNICEMVLRVFFLWPEREIEDCCTKYMYYAQQVETQTREAVKFEIEDKRTKAHTLRNLLFTIENEENASMVQEAVQNFREWLNWAQACCNSDSLTVVRLPNRLRKAMKTLEVWHNHGHEDAVARILGQLETSSKPHIIREISKIQTSITGKAKTGIESSVETNAMSSALDRSEEIAFKPNITFVEQMEDVLLNLQTKWWAAIENVLDEVQNVLYQKKFIRNNGTQKKDLEAAKKAIISAAFDQLQSECTSSQDLELKVKVSLRSSDILCEVEEERLVPSTTFFDVFKLDDAEGMIGRSTPRISKLGKVDVKADETILRMFMIKTKSLLLVSTYRERTYIHRINFESARGTRQKQKSTMKQCREFAIVATLCDYNASNRLMAFLVGETIGIFKFDENFNSMENIYKFELSARSTLTSPFVDMFIADYAVMVTDITGKSQTMHIRSQQTSTEFNIIPSEDHDYLLPSQHFALGDGLIAACFVLSKSQTEDDTYQGNIQSVSYDDHRSLPILILPPRFLSDQIQAVCVGEIIIAFDPLASRLYVMALAITVRSDSYRIRQSSGHKSEFISKDQMPDDHTKRYEHWIWAFYHVFEKFPVRGFLDTQAEEDLRVTMSIPDAFLSDNSTQLHSNCKRYLELIMNDLRELNKPLGTLKLHDSVNIIDGMDMGFLQSQCLQSLLRTLVTFVPIQICRAEANTLKIMADGVMASGESEDEAMQNLNSVSIAQNMRFGLLSPLLSSWQGRCIVVTSMGKQSTGKSYFLNHLTGSSFAISGARCTDGAWMTVRILPDNVLLVVLDFEGLGSFERTDQEDVFLSVLNASISHFTIFRLEMRFDKEIDDLFTKFQKGMYLLKNDPRLFRGMLYMSVKDVNPNDKDSVVGEFRGKFQTLLSANKERNFVMDMYSGQLLINHSPPLGTVGYYQSLKQAQRLIERNLCADVDVGFETGSSFLDCLRLVLAKISILDWTSLDESAQAMEVANFESKVPGVLRTGCSIPSELCREEIILSYHKDPIVSITPADTELHLCTFLVDYPNFASKWQSLDAIVNLDTIRDEVIDFGVGCVDTSDGAIESIERAFKALFSLFLTLIPRRNDEKLQADDYANFDAFLGFVVRRRIAKVALWAKRALGSNRFIIEWENVKSSHIGRFSAIFTRCQSSCSVCRLGCMNSACHSVDVEHDCGMDHACRGKCEYCGINRETRSKIPLCAGKAGHEGRCECVNGDHTCGAECALAGAANCGHRCTLTIGHSGDHKCSAREHTCGRHCDATNCNGKCVLSVEREHTIHKCAELQCKLGCDMQDCVNRCREINHFHDQPQKAAIFAAENLLEYTGSLVDSDLIDHMCGSGHRCMDLCEHRGVCHKYVKSSISKFIGQRSTFDYQLQEMVEVRNKCGITLASGQRNHIGQAHMCSNILPDGSKSTHFCTSRCVACGYLCDKPIGHVGLHSASHGNMRNTYFVSDLKAIDMGDRQYQNGERGIAEMCNLHCSTSGRGHVHFMKCASTDKKSCLAESDCTKRRHCTSSIEPRPSHEMDEMLHEEYWKTLGWEDPCLDAEEREQFELCHYKCDAPEHSEKGKESFCTLPAWHDEQAAVKMSRQRDGSSLINGHRFMCSHTAETGAFHHVFVLDCSGSMRGDPWVQLIKAVRGYINNRIVKGALNDLVSVVTFGDRGVIEFEAVDILSAQRRDIPFRGGGTFYCNGLNPASTIISRNQSRSHRPVMIFFTDGRPADRKKGPRLAEDIRQRFAKYGLQTFAVGFGRVSEMGVAGIAMNLGGTYQEALTGSELQGAFHSISKSLGAHAGLVVD